MQFTLFEIALSCIKISTTVSLEGGSIYLYTVYQPKPQKRTTLFLPRDGKAIEAKARKIAVESAVVWKVLESPASWESLLPLVLWLRRLRFPGKTRCVPLPYSAGLQNRAFVVGSSATSNHPRRRKKSDRQARHCRRRKNGWRGSFEPEAAT